MKTPTIAIAIVIVLVLAGGAFAFTKKSKQTTTTPTNTSTTTPANTDTSTPANNTSNQENASTTITYTNDGFSPATLSVKSGTTITIKNDSSGVLQFDSDPHPVHTDNPELNVGTISPGKSKTVTVTKTGSHGYHNHLNDSDKGTLVVQ